MTDNGYTGTVGVVTPFRAQTERIRAAIERSLELVSALAKNDFLVDTVHKFQGDERDLMFSRRSSRTARRRAHLVS